MSVFQKKISCPICHSTIPFDTKQLLAGIQFSCPQCHSSIGLATESKEIVKKTMIKLEELKLQTSK